MAKKSQTRLNKTAAGIGLALGKVAARVDALKKQRAAVSREIQSVISAAQRMLADLGGSQSTRAAASPRRRNLSPEARERIAEAQRRRWARARAAKK